MQFGLLPFFTRPKRVNQYSCQLVVMNVGSIWLVQLRVLCGKLKQPVLLTLGNMQMCKEDIRANSFFSLCLDLNRQWNPDRAVAGDRVSRARVTVRLPQPKHRNPSADGQNDAFNCHRPCPPPYAHHRNKRWVLSYPKIKSAMSLIFLSNLTVY